MRPSRPATLPCGGGTDRGRGSDALGGFATEGLGGLLGFAGRGFVVPSFVVPSFAVPGFAGATVCGFSICGERGFSGRGEWGMLPRRAASDVGGLLLLSSFDGLATQAPQSPPSLTSVRQPRPHHQPNDFHHRKPTVLQIVIVTSETRNPYFHHSRCVTYRAPK